MLDDNFGLCVVYFGWNLEERKKNTHQNKQQQTPNLHFNVMFELDAKIHRHQSFTIVWFEIVSHRRQFDNWHNNYCEYFFFSLVFHCAMTRASQFLASDLDWWMTNIRRRRRRQLLWLSLVCNDHITLAENGVVSLCNSLATIQSTMQSLSSSRWHCVLLVPAKKTIN